MWKILVLAARNLLRHRSRTAITGAAVAGGVSLMVVTIDLREGEYRGMLDNGISALAGHVVVQGVGWQQERKPEILVHGADELAGRLSAEYPDAIVTQRIWVDGLLTSPTSSAGVAISGVDPGPEATVGRLDDQVVEGTWLTGNAKGIALGAGLAQTLGVGLGDKVVYLGQHGGGDEMTSRLFRVEGIFRTGAPDVDGFTAVVPLAAARELVGGGDVANQVALHLADPRAWEQAFGTVKGEVTDPAVEVLPWPQAIPEIDGLIQVSRVSNTVLMAILGAIVAVGVLNTILMSVMERVREFGVLMAIGMKPRQLAGMVLLEGGVLGVVAVSLGVALGLVLSYPLVTSGFDVTRFNGGQTVSLSGVVIDTVMHAAWDVPGVIRYAVFGVLFCVAAACWPAWRVTRFEPVEALHHH